MSKAANNEKKMNKTILFYLLVQSAVENAFFQCVYFDLVSNSGFSLSYNFLVFSVPSVRLLCHS